MGENVSELISRPEYEERIAASRDARMSWWREARFGMFVHFGLYALIGRHEWTMALENVPIAEYEKLADRFAPEPGAPRAWAKLAKAAGMKYMVMTSKHHEGFCLWDSDATDYCAGKRGPKRDIVGEYVEACRAEGLRIGFYYSLMDWHHPDGWRCAFDPAARKRFTDYTKSLVRELLTKYGKIDILWYDVARPMENWEGWDSLAMNQMAREIQPDIIINNRSLLPEDFGTPEEHISAQDADWEACMTFNGLSWGYVDSAQAAAYSYNAQRILKMLNAVSNGGGNLLLNIGPTPEGGVPQEAVEPLTAVGKWLKVHGEAAYGTMSRVDRFTASGCGSLSVKGTTAYFWAWIWPTGGELGLGGFTGTVKSATIVGTGEILSVDSRPYRTSLTGLPKECPDSTAGVGVIALEFDEPPSLMRCAGYPQLHAGRDVTGSA